MKRFFSSLVVLSLLLPAQALAQTRQFSNPLSAGSGSKSTGVSVPLDVLLLNGVRWFMPILAIISFVFVIIGGMQIGFAAGNDEMMGKGKKTLLFAILGLVIAFTGFVLIPVLLSFFPSASSVQSGAQGVGQAIQSGAGQ